MQCQRSAQYPSIATPLHPFGVYCYDRKSFFRCIQYNTASLEAARESKLSTHPLHIHLPAQCRLERGNHTSQAGDRPNLTAPHPKGWPQIKSLRDIDLISLLQREPQDFKGCDGSPKGLCNNVEIDVTGTR